MKAMRHYVATVYGPPGGGTDEWFEQKRAEVGAPAGTYGICVNTPTLGYTVVSVAEDYTGPFVLGQSWVFSTREAAEKEARTRRRRGLDLAAKKRAPKKRPAKRARS